MRRSPSPSSLITSSLVSVVALTHACGFDEPTVRHQSVAGELRAASIDLFISEYVEGSGNNKAIEIFNRTGATVDLSNYQLRYSFNGGTSVLNIPLSGSLADGNVHVVAHASADPSLVALADQTSSASWYNGNDAVILLHTGVEIDVIGQVGFNPGTEWGSGLASTADNTLRRKSSVFDGDPDGSDAFDPSVEWDGYATNDWSGIGVHEVDDEGDDDDDSGDDDDDDGDDDDGDDDDDAEVIVPISEVQGSGAASPLVGQTVTIEAVVVADYQPGSELGGFFVQEEAADEDGNAATSEGLFVYYGSTPVAVGDRVRVTGTVVEYFGKTELTSVSAVSVIESGVAVPTAASVTLPLSAPEDLEAFEGMLVQFAQTLTVTETYELGRYGTMALSSGGRLFQPTQVVSPGAAAIAQQAANDLNRILLDDFRSAQNPDPVIHPAPELSAGNTLRSGDTVDDIVGVLDYGFEAYRVQPVGEVRFVDANARPSAPARTAELRVVSFNVLNYFNGDGLGGGFPTSRGADSPEEFERQSDKIVDAIVSLRADIVGLVEIENDGYSETSAIVELAQRLSDEGTEYAAVDVGVAAIGTDEIAVGLVYRPDVVAPVGAAAVLDTSVDPRFLDTKNRPALAQTFEVLASGERLTVVVNHLKSKGSACDDVSDPDTGDGQGNCNVTRLNAALAEVDWLATDPTGSGDPDVLVLGDLNAYAQEDPVQAFVSDGYVNVPAAFTSGNEYTYVFDGQAGSLDHALANESLAAQVVHAATWPINADEPIALDYNTEFKSANQVTLFYAPDAYRSSDHDPVVVDLDLASDETDLPPSFEILRPQQGSVVTRNAKLVVLATDAEDEVGTLLVEKRADTDCEWIVLEHRRGGRYRGRLFDSRPSRGWHKVWVRVTDRDGNVVGPVARRVFVAR